MATQLTLLCCFGKGRYKKHNPTPTESTEQEWFVTWLKKMGLKFYAVPNGGYRRPSEAVKFVRGGVSKGVPDICIPLPIKPYHGLYIELKRKIGGKVSKEQQEWINYLNSVGYRAVICNGFIPAQLEVKKYLDGAPPQCA